jgi:hypothetical protein
MAISMLKAYVTDTRGEKGMGLSWGRFKRFVKGENEILDVMHGCSETPSVNNVLSYLPLEYYHVGGRVKVTNPASFHAYIVKDSIHVIDRFYEDSLHTSSHDRLYPQEIEPYPYWKDGKRADGRQEWLCPHGVGHGNHVHGCCQNGCCSRADYPGHFQQNVVFRKDGTVGFDWGFAPIKPAPKKVCSTCKYDMTGDCPQPCDAAYSKWESKVAPKKEETPKTNIKVGDTVLVIEGRRKGDKVTVAEVYIPGIVGAGYIVTTDGWSFPKDYIQKIAPEPKFKVGEWVTLTEHAKRSYPEDIKKYFGLWPSRIKDVTLKSDGTARYVTENSKKDYLGYITRLEDSDIELYTKPEKTFVPGQRVRITAITEESMVLPVGRSMLGVYMESGKTVSPKGILYNHRVYLDIGTRTWANDAEIEAYAEEPKPEKKRGRKKGTKNKIVDRIPPAEKQKIYSEVKGKLRCMKQFPGKFSSGAEAKWDCYRAKGHKGPHQWPEGERSKLEDSDNKGIYTEQVTAFSRKKKGKKVKK